MTLEQLLEMGLDEETAKKILKAYQESIKDQYVPIARFNEVNEEKKELKNQLEERNKQLKELKEKAEGNEELIARITELEELNKQTQKDYEEKIATLKKETAIELKLRDEKAKNIKAVKALLDLEKVSLDGENLIGLEEQLKGLKETDPYLFGEDKLSGREPKPPGNPVGDEYKKNPWSKEHFNLTEQGRIYRENPELAAKLKAAAEGK
ncbi:phage scaffolding protein [Tepidimicrobium xylanilyticum]|uniref:Phage minor structural protein GP20 n=1 Tax=Tepidimicrobium xylanilyticum TaxID=1123352 RepID=A0A1H3FE14_9FIRM|nr:phage scaffolding protein [Tepidimicrobium xylanilyticum]SDX89206.1 Phage minor structural protein GP20 [Tepidimicrobium xylanilyticum]